jgi:eukaryotic-like serine/threonine-protein kinase
MDVERRERVKQLIEAALEREESERLPFLSQACQNDEELRREVQALLSGEKKPGDLLPVPAPGLPLTTPTSDNPPSTFSPGEIISGRFRVLRLIGRGGMGEVYEARDLDRDVRVALKTIRPEIASDPKTLARFKQEIELALRVAHRNVCRVHDLERHQPPQGSGKPEIVFLTMELLEGETLADRLRRQGRMTCEEALPLIRQMADGLVAAHSVGVIHRDFKPGNVMLVPEKPTGVDARILSDQTTQWVEQAPSEPRPLQCPLRVVITDFGLARTTEAAGSIHDASASLTAVRHIIGTPDYMAPEQLEGREAAPASDIYALGLVIYEMITGHQPFPGDPYRRLREPPSPPRLHVPALDPHWEAVILRCLEIDPAQRFASARDLATAVAAMSSSPLGTPFSAAAVGTPPLQDSQVIAGLAKRHQKAVFALIAAGMVIVAALIYAFYRAASHAPASPATLEFARVTGSGDLQQADISPDGKYVAYVRETAGKQSLWLKQVATDSDVQIATLGEDRCPGLAFSPDGSYVYFVRQKPLKRNGDLYQVPALGGSARRKLAGISGPPAFSPDGQRIAFVRETLSEFSLLTASLDGSGERTLASYKETEWIGTQRVAWSPDGKTLAFAHFSPQPVLTTIGAEGGPARPLAGAYWNWILDLTWLPGSRHLVVAGSPQGEFGTVATSQLYEVSVEGGEVRQITQDLSRYIGVRASADGKTLLALQEQILATLQVARPGQESEATTCSAGNQNGDGDNGLAWTPDGKIVYCSVHNARYDLWEIGADGSNPQRLTNNDASSGSFNPVVSLRGGFIAFVQHDRSNRWNIWRVDMDGGNLKQLTQGRSDGDPSVSPDGEWVIFSQDRGGEVTLMRVPSGGGAALQLTNYNSIWPSVSPDGKWIALGYSLGENQPVSLAVIPFAGGQPAKVFPLPGAGQSAVVWTPAALLWTPDGNAISFLNSVNGVDNIWEQPMTGGPPKPVTHFTSGRIFAFDWSRDGRLALSRGTDTTDAVLIQSFR